MYSKETCGTLIALMVRFSLLCSWVSDGEHKQYLVPSMLMSPPSDDLVELLSSVRIPSLFVRFELGRVPPGLFTRLVLQIISGARKSGRASYNPSCSGILLAFTSFLIKGCLLSLCAIPLLLKSPFTMEATFVEQRWQISLMIILM